MLAEREMLTKRRNLIEGKPTRCLIAAIIEICVQSTWYSV